MSSYSNFTNGALLMRLWRFDGTGEVVAKAQYWDHACLLAQAMVDEDGRRNANADGKWFYLAVCESECQVKAFFDPQVVKPLA